MVEVCSRCGKEIVAPNDFTTGYGKDKDGNIFCFQCCGDMDAEQLASLKPGEKMMLYLTHNHGMDGCVSNWPGTLKIKCHARTGRHNFAGVRYDVWFTFAGHDYHGVTYGDNTQICHVKRIKGGF